MAILNFPANPSDGQEYNAPTGVIYSYSSQYNVWTAFNPPAPTGYVTNVTHFFDNATNTSTILTSSNPQVIITALNPEVDGPFPAISCPFNPIYKKYGVTFATPFLNNTYTVDYFNDLNIGATGVSSAYHSHLIENKTASGFTIQICVRPVVNPGLFALSYRRGFSIAVSA